MRAAPGRALLLAILVLAAGCDSSDSDQVADDLARERGAAFFAEQRLGDARAAIAPLVHRKKPAFDDLVHAAAIEFADGSASASSAFLDRAAAIDPGAPEVDWLRGQIARGSGGADGFRQAREHFRAVHEKVPDDLPARLALAEVELELGDPKHAEELYRSVVAAGIERGERWYVAAVYRLWRLLIDTDRADEADRYLQIKQDLERRGAVAPDALSVSLGNLGRFRPPRPAGSRTEEPREPPPFRTLALALSELGSARELFAHDLDGDGDLDLLAAGPRGVAAGLADAGAWTAAVVEREPARWVRAIDVDNNGDLDLLVRTESGLALHACVAADDAGASGAKVSWERSPIALPPLPSPAEDAVAVDFDHEGDLDLLVVGAFGARLWRNDGADDPASGGGFTDATEGAGLPTDEAFAWCLTEDFDGDNDVDFLLGGRDVLWLADNLRAGRFADRSSVLPPGLRLEQAPLAADFDGDARADFWPAGVAEPWLQAPDGSFRMAASEKAGDKAGGATAAEAPDSPRAAIDLDLDGSLDIVLGGSALAARLAAGTRAMRVASLRTDPPLALGASLAAGDLDGDHDVDLATSTADGVALALAPSATGRAKRLALRGIRDNRRAVGAVAEYRAGAQYRRIYWRGDPVLLGVDGREKIDVLRVTWPNGVVGTRLDVDLGEDTPLDDPNAVFGEYGQTSGQIGSCPFLYAWNGRTFGFVSDVLGITPLGLPMAPGMMVPPDHDEYVLVRGSELEPRDGFLDVQVTEELREVTYLDQARLFAVDHPKGTAIYPNERFTFPPFPEAKIHVVRETLAPERARGSDDKDWTDALARVDEDHAMPFEIEPPQYGGLAKPWYLELAFDRAAVEKAPRLRLVMTGWLFWADASSNMASARHPRVEFVPPILQVPETPRSMTWRDAGPPVGFPAGKTKTMVLDVTDLLSREDPRIRVATTLRLYWDSIVLAIDAGEEPTTVQTLDPSSATLWRRGFSAPLGNQRPGEQNPVASRPERFDWNALAPQPRWNQHPGLYTRYGECAELVRELDDRFAILGAGDALTVRFSAEGLEPPADGFVRDWLVFLDGWAKDRDPNTLEALEVEPLPFHKMSGYPYAADERFPDDELHRAWRREWNTRPAHEWIRPIAPVREAEWLLGG